MHARVVHFFVAFCIRQDDTCPVAHSSGYPETFVYSTRGLSRLSRDLKAYVTFQAIQQAQLARSQAAAAPPADPAEAAAGARVRAYLEDVTTLHYCRAGDSPPYLCTAMQQSSVLQRMTSDL